MKDMLLQTERHVDAPSRTAGFAAPCRGRYSHSIIHAKSIILIYLYLLFSLTINTLKYTLLGIDVPSNKVGDDCILPAKLPLPTFRY